MFGEIAATMLRMPNRPAPPLIVDDTELVVLRSIARAGRTAVRAGSARSRRGSVPPGAGKL